MNEIDATALHKDHPIGNVLSWEQMRVKILEGVVTENRLASTDLPEEFELASGVMKELDVLGSEAISISDKDAIEGVNLERLAKETGKKIEAMRIIKTDPQHKRIFVSLEDTGVSKEMIIGAELEYESVPYAIGNIHTHPIDELPSQQDVSLLLTGENIMLVVRTPTRVIILLRTEKTPVAVDERTAKKIMRDFGGMRYDELLSNDKAANVKVYLDDVMRRIGSKITDLEFFNRIGVAYYEAPIDSSRFRRKLRDEKSSFVDFYNFSAHTPKALKIYIKNHQLLLKRFIESYEKIIYIHKSYSEATVGAVAELNDAIVKIKAGNYPTDALNESEYILLRRFLENSFRGKGKTQFEKLIAWLCQRHEGATVDQVASLFDIENKIIQDVIGTSINEYEF